MSQKPKPPKRWTYKAFFELLPKDGWEPFPSSRVRRNLRAKFCVDCPVTAVARRLGTGDFCSWDFDTAAESMGLPPTMARNIVEAADTPNATHRAALLKACNLKERNAK